MEYKRKPTHISSEYEVDTEGNVYSMKFEKERKMNPFVNTQTGYHNLTLRSKGVRYNVSVHRLVATAFLPNPEDKPQVNHINGDKSDNRLVNLEWSTALENMRHAFKNKLINIGGVNSPNAKLTEDEVLLMYEMRDSGTTITKIADKFNMSTTQIWTIVNGKSWIELYQKYYKKNKK